MPKSLISWVKLAGVSLAVIWADKKFGITNKIPM